MSKDHVWQSGRDGMPSSVVSVVVYRKKKKGLWCKLVLERMGVREVICVCVKI